MRKLVGGVALVGILSFIISVGAVWSTAIAQTDLNAMHHEAHDQHAVMQQVYENYFAIRAALARDSLEGVSKNAKAIAEKLDSYLKVNTDESEINSLLTYIQAAAGALAEKNDLSGARTAFGDLSKNLVDYQAKYMSGKEEKAHVFMCDMVKKPWLQEDTNLGNPYFGSSMLKCGREIK